MREGKERRERRRRKRRKKGEGKKGRKYDPAAQFAHACRALFVAIT